MTPREWVTVWLRIAGIVVLFLDVDSWSRKSLVGWCDLKSKETRRGRFVCMLKGAVWLTSYDLAL